MMYNEQIEKQVIGRLKVDNPWWTEGVVPDFFRDMSPRLYLDIIYPLVTEKIKLKYSKKQQTQNNNINPFYKNKIASKKEQ